MSAPLRVVVVTATTNINRAAACLSSWGPTPKVIVRNGPPDISTSWQAHVANAEVIEQQEYLGTVPAFRLGVDAALERFPDAQVIACLHDDVIIRDEDWASKVGWLFQRKPECGLAGFSGAIGVGAQEIYQAEYKPMQLARIGFRSNLDDAEVHGIRSLLVEQVACGDGFSQIGRREFFEGKTRAGAEVPAPWTLLEELGVVHHAYDSFMGCLAARYGWATYYIPIRCKHLGGQTAVGDAGYQAWASAHVKGGDAALWEQAHRIFFDNAVDVLPLRV